MTSVSAHSALGGASSTGWCSSRGDSHVMQRRSLDVQAPAPALAHGRCSFQAAPRHASGITPGRPGNSSSIRGRSRLLAPAVGRDGLPLMALSPWDEFDRSFADMDRQFAQMERQMDRDFEEIFGRTSRTLEQQRQMLQEQQDAVRQRVQQQQQQVERGLPNIQVEQLEQRSTGRYSYYQSIQISSGGGISYPVAHVQTPPLFNPLLLIAAALAGAYAAVAAIFARNFDLTTYSSKSRWTLVPLWPVLALFSPAFRRQFTAVLQGRRAPVTKQEPDGGNAPVPGQGQ